MPDVPERCPDCGVVLQHPGTDKWMPIEEGTTAHTKERCLEHQLTAARAEAERYRQQYEALRAAIEDVADLLDLLRGAVEKARQLHCIDRDPYEDGRSVGLRTAVKWLRKALADHGGDDADGCVDAEVSDDV